MATALEKYDQLHGDFPFLTWASYENALYWDVKLDKQRMENFLSKIEGIDRSNVVFEQKRCYLWKGANRNSNTKGNQHGTFNIGDQKLMHAHRLMFILWQTISPDVVDRNAACPCGSGNRYQSCHRPTICHKCKDINGNDHNGLCMNPYHMRLGTQKDNMQDKIRHKTCRGKVAPGESNGNSKYTKAQVTALWQDLQNKGSRTLKTLAEQHGMPLSAVKDINRGRTWTHVTGKDNSKHIHKRKTQVRNGIDSKKEVKAQQETSNLTSNLLQGTKLCSKCKEVKHETDFNWRNKAKGLRKPCCRDCQRVENKTRAPKRKRIDRYAEEEKERVIRPGDKVKTCAICKETIPLRSMSSNGSYCKPCRRTRDRSSKLLRTK